MPSERNRIMICRNPSSSSSSSRTTRLLSARTRARSFKCAFSHTIRSHSFAPVIFSTCRSPKTLKAFIFRAESVTNNSMESCDSLHFHWIRVRWTNMLSTKMLTNRYVIDWRRYRAKSLLRYSKVRDCLVEMLEIEYHNRYTTLNPGRNTRSRIPPNVYCSNPLLKCSSISQLSTQSLVEMLGIALM